MNQFLTVKTHKVRFYVEPAVCIGVAAFLLLFPLQWVLACLLAATVHEAFHCLALRVCRREIYEIRVGINGAVIQASLGTGCQIVFCLIAGPFGGLLLLAFYSIYPQLAICAFLQTIFNLLPINSLDGGQVLRVLTAMVLPDTVADSVCRVVKVLILLLITICCIMASFLLHTYFFLMIPAVLFLKSVRK